MKIAFATFQLRNLFESSKKLKNMYGDELADNLISFFSDLSVAISLNEIIEFGHELIFISPDEILLKIHQHLSIQFKINDRLIPKNLNDVFDLSKIQHIKITGINHEKP